MSENTLIAQCSPTLAGIKTGSLFSYNAICPKTLCAELCTWNKLLDQKGLHIRVLKIQKGRALIYLYRKSALQKDLEKKEIREILESYGYHSSSPEKALRHLGRRFAQSEEFPHEIGLFLGYPPDDVQGFIQNKGENQKKTGIWKVYTDEERAEKMFRQYRRCTDIYSRRLREGTPILNLVVDV